MEELQSRHEASRPAIQQIAHLPSPTFSRKRSTPDSLDDIESASVPFGEAYLAPPPRKSPRLDTNLEIPARPYQDILAIENDAETCPDQEDDNTPSTSSSQHSMMSQLDRIADRFQLLPISTAVAIAEGKDVSDQGSMSDDSQGNGNMLGDEGSYKEDQYEVLEPEAPVEPHRALENDKDPDIDQEVDVSAQAFTEHSHEDVDCEQEPAKGVTFKCSTQFDEEIFSRDEEDFSEEEVEVSNRFGLQQDTLGEVHPDFWEERQSDDHAESDLLQDTTDANDGVQSQISTNEKEFRDQKEAEISQQPPETDICMSQNGTKLLSSHGSLSVDGIEDVATQSTTTQDSKCFDTQDYGVQDESRRPHRPRRSGQYVEVDDEIIDSSPRLHRSTQRQLSRSYHRSASQIPSRKPSLNLVSRKHSPDLDANLMSGPYGRQPFIGLRRNYKKVEQPRRLEIPETQFEELSAPEIPESQLSYITDVPIASYFSRASHDLCNPGLWSVPNAPNLAWLICIHRRREIKSVHQT
jgi:hypothetical protein